MDLYAQDRNLVPTFHQDGLTLRPIVRDDADAIVSALSQWRVTRWLTNAPFPFGHENAIYFIDEIANAKGEPFWAIDRGSGLIGVISVKPDLGYWLHPEQHGKGMMTRAVAMACDHHFEGPSTELVSGHFLGNAPSRAVLKKAGFEDTHKEDAVQVSTQKTVVIQRMALTRQRWQTLRSQAQ